MTIILYIYRRKKNDKDNNTVTYVHHEGVPLYETPSPLEYRANLISSTFVQEYEEPSSINNTIAREPENSQSTEVYSSLNPASIERHLYSSYTAGSKDANPNYTSLHPLNMDDKHTYTHTIQLPVSTFMNEDPSPNSEPVTSSTHKPVSELESSDSYYKPGHESVSHESSNTDDNNSNKPKRSEPTYFELERRDGVTGTGTGTGSNIGTTPLYFELERRDGNGTGTGAGTNRLESALL